MRKAVFIIVAILAFVFDLAMGLLVLAVAYTS
jgi:hypothetical protein